MRLHVLFLQDSQHGQFSKQASHAVTTHTSTLIAPTLIRVYTHILLRSHILTVPLTQGRTPTNSQSHAHDHTYACSHTWPYRVTLIHMVTHLQTLTLTIVTQSHTQ